MTHSRVFKLFELLQAREKLDFANWLLYKLGSAEKKLYQFYQLMASGKSESELWAILFPTIPYDNAKLRKLCNRLQDYLETYFTSLALEQQNRKPQKDLLFLRTISEREINHQTYQSLLNKVKNRLDKGHLRNSHYYRYLYELEALHQEYLIAHSPKGIKRRELPMNQALDIWMMHEKLLTGLINLNHQMIYNEEIPSPLLDAMISELTSLNPQASEMPLLYIYQQLFYLLKGQAIDLDQLWDFILTYKDRLHINDRQNILFIILNYRMQQVNREGTPENYQQLFDLYQYGLQTELLLVKHFLPHNQYKNIVLTALHLDNTREIIDFKSAIKCIEDLKYYLPENDQEEASRFAMGSLAFFLKEYKQAIKLLNPKFTHAPYAIQARFCILQARYEQDPESLEDNDFRRLRVFLKRQQGISKVLLTTNLNRIELLRRIVFTNEKKRLHKLASEVLHTQPLNDKSWLLEKIADKLT